MKVPARPRMGVVIHALTDPLKFSVMEKMYHEIRLKEGRIYPIEVLKTLPFVGRDHPLYKEWRARRRTMEDILDYFQQKRRSLKILDVGTGNGWMAKDLAEWGHEVFAIDVNFKELAQAVEAFGDNPRVKFAYADIFTSKLPETDFDIAVLGSSIQYFPDIKKLFSRLFELLKPEGEIHIVDSPFYKPEEVESARKRTLDYYTRLGYPAMADYYHHHSYEEMEGFHWRRHDYKLAFGITGWLYIKKFRRFPWIIIKNNP